MITEETIRRMTYLIQGKEVPSIKMEKVKKKLSADKLQT